MNPKVNQQTCQGFGVCAAVCPKVFQLKNGKSQVINSKACDSCDCETAKNMCPTHSITLE